MLVYVDGTYMYLFIFRKGDRGTMFTRSYFSDVDLRRTA